MSCGLDERGEIEKQKFMHCVYVTHVWLVVAAFDLRVRVPCIKTLNKSEDLLLKSPF